MKIKTKIIISIASAVIVLGGGLAIASANSEESFFTKWGKVLKENTIQTYSDDLYAEGNNSCITKKDYEQTLQFELLSGLNQEEAEKEAYKYVTEREALYYQAVKAGYSVTEEEARAYIEELKKMTDEADNKEDISQLIAQFDSEEDYWEYEVTVYMKNLPIQNYVKDLEKNFLKNNETEATWDEYFAELKEQYAAEENYKRVE